LNPPQALGTLSRHAIDWMAATCAEAHTAFDRFVSVHAARYPKATEALKRTGTG